MNTFYTRFAILFLLVLSIGCQTGQSIETPIFDSVRAFSYLEQQVAFGPRVPGSKASADCRNFFYEKFHELQIPVDSQPFTFFDKYSNSNIEMCNVIASIKVKEDYPTIVLMAHYDSRPRTDNAINSNYLDKPIDGASDGASGVAVLLEMAHMFSAVKPDLNIDIVFVDGEDWGKSGDIQYYMLGSKEFARKGIRGKYKFGIVVDMVGDRELTIYREQYSENNAKSLNDAVFETATKLQVSGFIDSLKYAIQDDHLSLITAGVPAIDIIDFDYRYWHTELDTPVNCSAKSLEAVGKVVAEVLYNKSIWQKIK